MIFFDNSIDLRIFYFDKFRGPISEDTDFSAAVRLYFAITFWVHIAVGYTIHVGFHYYTQLT